MNAVAQTVNNYMNDWRCDIHNNSLCQQLSSAWYSEIYLWTFETSAVQFKLYFLWYVLCFRDLPQIGETCHDIIVIMYSRKAFPCCYASFDSFILKCTTPRYGWNTANGGVKHQSININCTKLWCPLKERSKLTKIFCCFTTKGIKQISNAFDHTSKCMAS